MALAATKIRRPIIIRAISLVISKGVEEYANLLMKEDYAGWEINIDDIIVMEPVAVRILYEHICGNIGFENFVNNIKKGKSKEVIKKCKLFLSRLDPNNTQGWTKYFD
jgi:hypothetical protein